MEEGSRKQTWISTDFYSQNRKTFEGQCIYDFLYIFSDLEKKKIENLQIRKFFWIDFLVSKKSASFLMEENSLIALNPPYVDGLVVGRLKLATVWPRKFAVNDILIGIF